MTKDKAQAASDQLMAEWRKKHPEANWDDMVADNKTNPAKPTPARPARKASAACPSPRRRRTSTTSTAATTRATSWSGRGDAKVHRRGQRHLPRRRQARRHRSRCRATCAIQRGQHASRDLPEVSGAARQVALLRDMINWCIENPVRASRCRRRPQVCARSRPISSRSAKAPARLRQALVPRHSDFDRSAPVFDVHGFVAPPRNTDSIPSSSRLALNAESSPGTHQNHCGEVLATHAFRADAPLSCSADPPEKVRSLVAPLALRLTSRDATVICASRASCSRARSSKTFESKMGDKERGARDGDDMSRSSVGLLITVAIAGTLASAVAVLIAARLAG